MNAHHPYHSAHLNQRTSKTPIVLTNKRRKWALSLSPKRLSSILLLYVALLAGTTVITAQTLQPSPLASTASADNVLATARDKVQPTLSVAIVPDHAVAGGSSFIKRAVRGVLGFTKPLFSVFGEGGTSTRKVEAKSKDQDEVTISSAATVYSPGIDRQEGSAKVLLVEYVWRNKNQQLGKLLVPPGYSEDTKSYTEGVRTTLTYPDGSYLILHVGGMIKLPFFSEPEHEVSKWRKLANRVVREGKVRNTELLWREDNSYGVWPPNNLGFTNVPRSRVKIFEDALASFKRGL
jgi:hypothetical protein